MRRLTGAGAVLLVIAAGALAQQQADVQQVTGFRVPSYDSEGYMTSQMFGDTARFLADGMVEITELRLEFYSKAVTNRETQMRVTSPKCFYNRDLGLATSAAPVRIARDNMVVTGTGFTWSSKDERLRILSESKVVLKDVKRSMKGVSAP